MKKINYDIRSFPSGKYICALVYILFGLVYPFQVNAADARDVFNHLYNQSGQPGYDVYGPASTSRALVVSNSTLEADGSSSLRVNRSFTAKNPSGIGVDLMRKSSVRAGHIAAGIYGAYKILTPLGVAAVAGSALYDVAKELSFDFGENAPDGSLTVTKTNITQRLQWEVTNYGSTRIWTTDTTGKDMCAVFGVGLQGPLSGVPGQLWYTVKCTNFLIMQITKVEAPTNTETPATLEDLRDAIASKSGWPTTSRIAEAVLESSRITGNPPEEVPENNPDGSPITGPDAPSVTGPSSSSGPPPEVSTTSKPDGSTERTTKTTTHNHTYQGNTVTTTTVTNNIVESCTGAGSCATTTTTTTKTPTRDDQSHCEKNPESVGCQEIDLDTPEGEIPKTEKNITYQAENLGLGGGACPADKIINISGIGSVTAFDWVTACGYITGYVKPMILALAAFAALGIIFIGVKIE